MALYSVMYAGPPRHYGGTRTTKRYIAIHNTANDATAEEEASYARRREDSVSSHYYVDTDSIRQSLDTALRAYHAGSTTGNSQAIAYEITGTNGKSRSWWLANVAWPLLARQIAADCREHRIEPRLLTVAEIKSGTKTGIITHDQMRQAWGGTTHTDPGGNFPLDHMLALVRAELDTPGGAMDVTLSRGNRTTPKDVGDRGPGTQLDDLWGQEQAEKSPYDGAQSKRTLRLIRIETKLDQLLARPAGGDVDEAALAELLIPHLPEGSDAAAVAAAVGPVLRAELDKTRLAGV